MYRALSAHIQKEVNQWSVADELEVLALHAFPFVLVQFPLENVLVEEELQLLIGDIDADLFEAVVHEVLKARDVQDANCGA